MAIYQFEGVTPVIHPSAFIHPSSVIIGDVWIGAYCYIGPFASIRGDFNRIVIKEGSNVQDNCTIHGFPQQDCLLEENSHIGHGAIIHTATIGKNALIGMQALIMDFAQIGENAIVAAQSFVPANFQVPNNTLVMGSPCKIIKEISLESIKNKSIGTQLYIDLALKSSKTLKEIEPLREDDFNRKRIDWGKIEPISTKN